MAEYLTFDRSTRPMALAPHPDDESLAIGGLLNAAIGAGATVHVVYLTNGGNNPWPQRVIERRWRIGAEDRIRWGLRRRDEALSALQILGIPAEAVSFLDYPDQGITDLLIRGDDGLAERLAAFVDSQQPTLLVTPSLSDIHPDHNAAAVYVRQAMACLKSRPELLWLEYLIHTRNAPTFARECVYLSMSPEQRIRKRSAIACHKTQTLFRSRELYAFAEGDEGFISVSGFPESLHPNHPVRESYCMDGALRLKLVMSACLRALGPMTLYLAANQHGRAKVRTAMRLPRYPSKRSVHVCDTRTSKVFGRACFVGGPRKAEIVFEHAAWESTDQLFVKLDRGFGFFDDAGWLELPVPSSLRQDPSIQTDEPFPPGARQDHVALPST